MLSFLKVQLLGGRYAAMRLHKNRRGLIAILSISETQCYYDRGHRNAE